MWPPPLRSASASFLRLFTSNWLSLFSIFFLFFCHWYSFIPGILHCGPCPSNLGTAGLKPTSFYQLSMFLILYWTSINCFVVTSKFFGSYKYFQKVKDLNLIKRQTQSFSTNCDYCSYFNITYCHMLLTINNIIVYLVLKNSVLCLQFSYLLRAFYINKKENRNEFRK